MEDMMKGLRQRYLATIREIGLEHLSQVLPSSSYSNYLPLMRGILEELNSEVVEWQETARSCTNPEEKAEYEKEAKMASEKLRFCEEQYRQNYAIEEEPPISEKEEIPKFHLIYGINPAGNIPFKYDLERDVDIHYYAQIISMLEDLEQGNNKGNQLKRKRFSSAMKSMRGLSEIKDFQIRIIYRELPNNILYVEMIRIKKDDWSFKDKNEIATRDALLSKDYARLKQKVKAGDKVEELIISNQEITTKIKEYIEKRMTGRKK